MAWDQRVHRDGAIRRGRRRPRPGSRRPRRQRSGRARAGLTFNVASPRVAVPPMSIADLGDADLAAAVRDDHQHLARARSSPSSGSSRRMGRRAHHHRRCAPASQLFGNLSDPDRGGTCWGTRRWWSAMLFQLPGLHPVALTIVDVALPQGGADSIRQMALTPLRNLDRAGRAGRRSGRRLLVGNCPAGRRRASSSSPNMADLAMPLAYGISSYGSADRVAGEESGLGLAVRGDQVVVQPVIAWAVGASCSTSTARRLLGVAVIAALPTANTSSPDAWRYRTGVALAASRS